MRFANKGAKNYDPHTFGARLRLAQAGWSLRSVSGAQTFFAEYKDDMDGFVEHGPESAGFVAIRALTANLSRASLATEGSRIASIGLSGNVVRMLDNQYVAVLGRGSETQSRVTTDFKDSMGRLEYDLGHSIRGYQSAPSNRGLLIKTLVGINEGFFTNPDVREVITVKYDIADYVRDLAVAHVAFELPPSG